MGAWYRGNHRRLGNDTIQFGPPFVVKHRRIDEFCNMLADVIGTTP